MVPLPPDVSAGPMMLQAIWAMDGIAAVIVALRLISSAWILRKVSLADYLMVTALLFGISNNVCITISEHYGLGRHIMYLSPFQIVHALKWQTIAEPIGILSPTLGRVSFACYLLKLVGPDKSRRWTLWFCIYFSLFINALCIILIFAQCQHPQKIYDQHAPGKCWSRSVQTNYGYFQGACNTIVDFILTMLPAFLVWKLQLTRRVKIGLAVLLGLSVFAAVASVVKTVKLGVLGAGGDITHNLVDFVIWFTVENNVVIAAASIPTLRPLFVRAKASSTGQNSGGSYQIRSLENPKRKGYISHGSSGTESSTTRNDGGIRKETVITSVSERFDSDVELTSYAEVHGFSGEHV